MTSSAQRGHGHGRQRAGRRAYRPSPGTLLLIERDDPTGLAARISLKTSCAWLACHADADVRGRICADQQQMLDNIALFRELARDVGCLDTPLPFPSDHSRFLYFRRDGRHPGYEAFDDTSLEVVLMCGLPAAGKDGWIRSNLPDWPVISLDALREELGLRPGEVAGRLIAMARERARQHMRQGQSFVWNATNLTRRVRAPLIELFASYQARVRIVYIEVTEPTLRLRNRRRKTSVPDDVIDRMIKQWEMPELTEAHRVDWFGELRN